MPIRISVSKLVQIRHNNVTAEIFRGSDQAKLAVSDALTYVVEGYDHMPSFKKNGWDGRSSFFDWTKSTFPRGFVTLVEQELRAKGYQVQLISREIPPPLGPVQPVVDDFGYTQRYDYQWGTVDRLTKFGQMIARIATGGGKSRIAKMAYARIARPTLFVTTRKALMYQMKKGFEASGWKVGVMGDSVWEPETSGNAPLNVAMIQTLAARLAEPEPGDKSPAALRQLRIRKDTIELLGTFEFLIGEEAHESGGESYYQILRHCRSAAYRLALTATPFMRADAEDNMRLMASFGTIGIEVSEKLLIDRGILARPIFQFFDNSPPSSLRKTTPWQRAQELGIMDAENRNQAIVETVSEGREYGLTSMVLVTRKKHGAILRDAMRAVGLRVVFIFGDTDQTKRDQALEMLAKGHLDVLIGSTILDVGVDVPAVGMIVLAGGGKAEVALRQRIGRGLREKKSGPNVCFILDFRDRGNKHLQQHAISRHEVIQTTPGFAENVLPIGKGFDFAAHGFSKPACAA